MAVLRKLFGKYLLITNTVSCGLMMGFGDLIQQRNDYWKRNDYYKFLPSGKVMAASPELYANNKGLVLSKVSNNKEGSLYKHDYVRTKNMVIVGLFQGPFHHYFYLTLDRILPGRNAMTIIKKTCLDQSIASPTCLGIFFIGLGLLEHRNFKDIYNEIKLKFWETWKVDCFFWPPTQCINFLLVPIQYRVLYINVMTMVYDIFLSYVKYVSFVVYGY